MLFETVYGPELERVHMAIRQLGHGEPVPRAALYDYFVPGGASGALKNLQDAVAFLRSARLVSGHDDLVACEASPFQLALLQRLRLIQGDAEASPLDRAYFGLLDELFVLPNRVYRSDVHSAANSRGSTAVTEERVNAWARVLEFFGLGQRVEKGFQCVYAPDVLLAMLRQHVSGTWELNAVLVDIVSQYVPTLTRDGDVSAAVWTPLAYLEEQAFIRLVSLQDSPARRFGPNGATHLVVTGSRRRPMRKSQGTR